MSAKDETRRAARTNATSHTDADRPNNSPKSERFSAKSQDSEGIDLTSTGQNIKEVLDRDIVERHARIGRQYSRVRKRS
jgi:hypothetical protein